MSTNTCSYDCRVPPKLLEAEPDISGIGVILAYTVTAGLAVCIVVIYYIYSFRPDAEPFNQSSNSNDTQDQHKSKSAGPRFRTNPIDECLLSWRLKLPHNHADVRRNHPEVAQCSRIQKALIDCMLLMSDLQLITGLAIMISGYAQLQCGLSAYHWFKIIRLAWFSSITHLCCLTFLRDHFRRHKMAQIWRIPGMIALIVMLIVGMYPTAQYVWDQSDSASGIRPQDYAICSLRTPGSLGGKPRIQMVLCSSVLLGVGMLFRLCCLYERPANACSYLRRWCSGKIRIGLRKLSILADGDSYFALFVSVFLYQPLLALFLTARITADVMMSKAFEVWWLVISFAWGAMRLWSDNSVNEPESRKWTFGQVIALLILLAPAIALIEGYLKVISCKESCSSILVSDTNSTTQRSSGPQTPKPLVERKLSPARRGDPDFDLYRHSASHTAFASAWLLFIASMSVVELWWLTSNPEPVVLLAFYFIMPPGFNTRDGIGFSIPVYFYACVLSTIPLESQAPDLPVRRRIFKIIAFLLYSAIFHLVLFLGHFSELGRPLYLALLLSCVAVYLLLSILKFCQKRRCGVLPLHRTV